MLPPSSRAGAPQQQPLTQQAQQFQPQQPQAYQQQQAEPKAEVSAALVRRPSFAPVQQQPVFLDMSQVVGKQVITRTTGRCLGIASYMWVDPSRGEVVSLDLDEKKGPVGGTSRVGNIPLSRLTQIGDVILVNDETVLYEQPLDGRFGFLIMIGMEVRTRSGDFLGKVRTRLFLTQLFTGSSSNKVVVT